MTEMRVPSGTSSYGEGTPLFAVLPNPASLFEKRAARLRVLAPGHSLEPYLLFAAHICEAQRETAHQMGKPSLPAADHIHKAFEHGMPPLARSSFEAVEEAQETLLSFLDQLRASAMPAEAAAAAVSLIEASLEARGEAIRDALHDAEPDNIPRRVLTLTGLQVHFAALAAQLDPARLKPIADPVCPTCGSLPATSMVVGWPGAESARFCACSLCGTMWNVVRVKCVLCSSTEGISYHSIEGKPETLKAESCEKCGGYLKILYQVKDHLLEPCADDIASLNLDMMLAEAGWRRGGFNPFLLGY
jgi:FdhE protein